MLEKSTPVEVCCSATTAGEFAEQEAFVRAWCSQKQLMLSAVYHTQAPKYEPGALGTFCMLPLVHFSRSQLFALVFERDMFIDFEPPVISLYALEGPDDATSLVQVLQLASVRFGPEQRPLMQLGEEL